MKTSSVPIVFVRSASLGSTEGAVAAAHALTPVPAEFPLGADWLPVPALRPLPRAADAAPWWP